MYQKVLNPVIEMFTTGEYYPELVKAKEEYFEKAGIIYEDDTEFESRMNTFMDWYIFDRELASKGQTPIKFYFDSKADSLSVEDADVLKGFCNTIHSIFYLLKVSGDKIVVEDLFSKKKHDVVDPEVKAGFMKGDIFEARIVPYGGKFTFSRGFCFHPVEMEKFILSEIKKVRFEDKAAQTKLILQLAAMKLKHSRFQHINIKHIYTFEPKF